MLKSLATVTEVQEIIRTNSILVEVDGSIRRITLDKFIDAINSGETELLRSVAWGIPIKQAVQSSSSWGRVGNLDMWAQFKYECGRYLVKNNGHAAKLSKTYSGIYADGTPLDESIGHIMFHAPRLYYRVAVDAINQVPYLWMSMIPIGGHFIDCTVGAYKASMSGTALTSRSGVKPAGSKTITAFWNAAQVNGKDWGLQSYDHRKFMMMLLLSEFGNPNSQMMVGNGVTGSNNGSDWSTPLSWDLGATKSLGDAVGKVDVSWTNSAGTKVLDSNHVSLFGIEDPWALQWEFSQGIYCGSANNDGQDGSEVFIYEGNRLPSASELASHPEGDYRQLTRLTSSGYIQKMTLGEYFDLVPSQHGGGGTSYWGDYHYANNTGQVVLWGCTAHSGALAGLVFLNSGDAWSFSRSDFGSRLAYYGDLVIMSGAQLVAE